jgi:hypothetical protein
MPRRPYLRAVLGFSAWCEAQNLTEILDVESAHRHSHVLGDRNHVLTSLGGGAFGNPSEWICSSILRALEFLAVFDLDVRIVSHGPPSPEIIRLGLDFV